MEEDSDTSRSRSSTWPLPAPDFEQAEQRALSSNASSKKPPSRRNPWGNLSYAELITQAILSSPEKRLTLSQVYEWMVKNVPYFADKADSTSSAGWKNSIRHNLSLHSRFMRIPNEGPGKSSWWVINPDAKSGRPARRRAVSTDTPATGISKSDTKRRGRQRRSTSKGAIDTAAAAAGSPASSPASSLVKLETDGPLSQHCLTPSSLCDSDSSVFGSTSPYEGYSPLGDAVPFTGPLPGTSEQFGTDCYHDQDSNCFLPADIASLSDPLSSLSVSSNPYLTALDLDGPFPPITIDSAPINPAPSTYVAPFQPTLSPISGTPLATPLTTPLGTPPALRHALRSIQSEDGQYPPISGRSLSTEQLYYHPQQNYNSQQTGMRTTGSWQHLNTSYYPSCNNPPPYFSQSWSPNAVSYRGSTGQRVALTSNDYHPLMPPVQHEPSRLTHQPMGTMQGSPVYGHTGRHVNQSPSERFPNDLDVLLRDSYEVCNMDNFFVPETSQADGGLVFDFEHFQDDQPGGANSWSHKGHWVH